MRAPVPSRIPRSAVGLLSAILWVGACSGQAQRPHSPKVDHQEIVLQPEAVATPTDARKVGRNPTGRARTATGRATFEQLVESEYRQPPAAIAKLLAEEAPPHPLLHAGAKRLALSHREKTIPLERLARLRLGLAGVVIDPDNHALFGRELIRQIEIHRLEPPSKTYQLLPPEGAALDDPEFSPDGRYLSASVVWPDRVGVVIFDLEGQTQTLVDEELSGVWGAPCQWTRQQQLLCHVVPRPLPPIEGNPILGPNITEHVAGAAPALTYRHLLANRQDDDLFERHFSSVPTLIDPDGTTEYLAIPPGLTREQTLSPDGQYLLLVTLKRPFSRVVPAERFPRKIELFSIWGERVLEIPLPSEGAWPTRGSPRGPQAFVWDPTKPASLVYCDVGSSDGRTISTLVRMNAPFEEAPLEVLSTSGRLGRPEWTTRDRLMVPELGADGRARAAWSVEASQKGAGSLPLRIPLPLDDALRQDGDRGRLLERTGATAAELLLKTSNRGRHSSDELSSISLEPSPVLRRVEIRKERHQKILTLLDQNPLQALVSRESLRHEPNYYVIGNGIQKNITQHRGKYAALAAARRIPLRYRRQDGVPLSGTLYLPTDYSEQGCRATVLWIYPGNEAGADEPPLADALQPFWEISGPSRFSLLLAGYALLDQPSMPILGPTGEENDNYLGQLKDSARAAIEELSRRSPCGGERVAVAGRSYGAFSTANLLIHTDLFQTGIAMSGAYNRTLTPFGFQTERRSFWEATEMYTRVSPFFHAHQLDVPLLLVHGEEDESAGTPVMQSERFFAALSGNGAAARFVSLPLEGHQIRGQESVLHTVAEMISWLDRQYPAR